MGTSASAAGGNVSAHRGAAALLILGLALAACPLLAQTADDLFNDQILQDTRLYMHPNDWLALKKNYGSNTYYPADFEWKFQGQRVELPGTWIRSRGAGSRSEFKPGLRVDVDRDAPGRRFLGLRSFALRNHTQDASMIHDPLAMVFFRRLGIPGPREAHTRLYVNNEYVGLYTIVESIDKVYVERIFDENDGYLYQYEDDLRIPYFFEYKGSDPALYSPNPFKPVTHEQDPDPRPIEAMVKAINQSSDADFVRAVSEYLDLKEFLALAAAERFLAEQDGIVGASGMNNFFMYRLENSTLSRLIAWDKDMILGGGPEESIWRFVTNVPAERENRLMRRALKVPELKAAYLSALARCAVAAGGEGGFLIREIEREYAHIRQAALEDPNKQCIDSTGETVPCTNAAFEGAFEYTKDFARRRSGRVLAETARYMESTDQRQFDIPANGTVSWSTFGVEASPSVGYARVSPAKTSSETAGLAIFGYRQGDILVTEAGVPLTRGITAGRVYAEADGPVNTGIAIANPGDQAASLTFHFTDTDGNDFGAGVMTLHARTQIARFLTESPFSGKIPLHGSFSFTSTLPVTALALRSYTNERSETLVTTLPVIEIGPTSQTPATVPHFAEGGGWTTRIVLVNTGDTELRGRLDFYGQGTATKPGEPVELSVAGRKATSFSYTLPGRSAHLLVTAGDREQPLSGSIRVVPEEGSFTPAASSVFSFRRSGVAVTEAGVPVVPSGNNFRLYAEVFGSPGEVGSIESGVALANPGTEVLSVKLELLDLAGKSAGSAATVSLPAHGQTARYLSQFEGLGPIQAPFQGTLRVTTSSAGGVAVIGLRGRFNERGDYLITTTPPVKELAAGGAAEEALLPHWVDGGGYTTQFVLLGTTPNSTSTGMFRTVSQSGNPLALVLW